MSLETRLAKFKSDRVVARLRKDAKAIGVVAGGLQGEDLAVRFKTAVAQKNLKLGFGCVMEAIRRVEGLVLHEEQLIGGLCLVEGRLAEMRTGEGKTLTVVGAAAWWAGLYGQVHVVTANAYLAKRDEEKLRGIYALLGLRSGVVVGGGSGDEKREAYGCDVVYGVGHEFGFDYLRDNLAVRVGDRVQRGLVCAVVDEVDSVLIDDARTPMVLAMANGEGDYEGMDARALAKLVRDLEAGEDYRVDLGKREVELLEGGFDRVERLLLDWGVVEDRMELYAGGKMYLLTMLNNGLRAHVFFRKGRDYVVEGGKVVLLDGGTGRKMEGRRLGEGLHEALEAREGLRVGSGSLTQGSVTYQNFFRMYGRLSGLTGTALSSADEFAEVYGLEVCVVPTHREVKRIDREDVVFLTKGAKFEGVAKEVVERRKVRGGQPVLVGCGSVRDAKVMSWHLKVMGVEHGLLTADNEEEEARVIGGAGQWGAVTIATNMAGRGTDILLGEGVREQGGLYVIVAEHNEIKRVDDQFAGRSGRQGDPGEVVFYCSLEDDLFERYAGGGLRKLKGVLKGMGGSGLSGGVVSRFVGMAQRKAQGEGEASRKSLAKFDELMSKQRDAVFSLRRDLLEGSEDVVRAWALECLRSGLEGWFDRAAKVGEGEFTEWDFGRWEALRAEVVEAWGEGVGGCMAVGRWGEDDVGVVEARGELVEGASRWGEGLFRGFGEGDWVGLRGLALKVVDEGWVHHLTNLEELRKNKDIRSNGSGMNLEYMFFLDAVELFRGYNRGVELMVGQEVSYMLEGMVRGSAVVRRKHLSGSEKVGHALLERWVGRNDECPCGSGKRYKECHGRLV